MTSSTEAIGQREHDTPFEYVQNRGRQVATGKKDALKLVSQSNVGPRLRLCERMRASARPAARYGTSVSAGSSSVTGSARRASRRWRRRTTR
jgi:hypothetical protein